MTARIACLAVLACLCVGGRAQAAPSLAAFTKAEAPPLSDGDRWAVIPVPGGMLVLDGDDHALSRRAVPLSAPCAARSGTPRGIGGGLVVIECGFVPYETTRLLVYDLVARTFTTVKGAELIPAADGRAITGIGRSWISFNGSLNPHGGSVPGLLDWRAGRVVLQGARNRKTVADLDAPSGSRRVCAAMRDPALRLVALIYRHPFGLSRRGVPVHRRLVLERCEGRSVTLTKPGRGLAVSLGERAVAWVEGETIHARALRGGAEKRWPAPRGTQVAGLVQVGRHLLVTMSFQGGTVYRGRLP